MKVLLDTNIILDYLLKRDPFFENARIIFKWAYQNKNCAFISATSITDIFYIVKKSQNVTIALSFINQLLSFTDIAGLGRAEIELALHSGITDFEDAVQEASARRVNANFIVTRNIKDFEKATIQTLSPAAFSEQYIDQTNL